MELLDRVTLLQREVGSDFNQGGQLLFLDRSFSGFQHIYLTVHGPSVGFVRIQKSSECPGFFANHLV